MTHGRGFQQAHALGDAIRALCEGEVLERERRFDPTVDVAHVRRVNRLKTAALFG